MEDQISEQANWAASGRGGGVGAGAMCGLTSLLLVVRLSFGTSRYVVAEGNRMTVTLESNVAIEMSFEVNVSTVEGTADGEWGTPFT